jgi:hypothetical protein
LTLQSLLYVSRSLIDPTRTDSGVAEIVETAPRMNPQRSLTGALIFTGSHFAQILEGPPDTVATMMASIACDPRHTDVLIAERLAAGDRCFGQWSMTYFGRVRFVERQITRLLEASSAVDRTVSAKGLRSLIHEFTVQ